MDDALSLERELFVPAELVFEVWTQREHLAAWYPGDGEQLAGTGQPLDFELRRTDDGVVLESVACIDADRARTLHWQVRCNAGVTLELTVGFAGGGGTCTLSLAERGFAGAAERARQEELWAERLERLQAYFSAI